VGKKSWRKSSFTPQASRAGVVPYVGYVGYGTYAGYEDFSVLTRL
jgi:hypothetical protein